jgi:hypothetical protein
MVHPFVDAISSDLVGLVPAVPIGVTGHWNSATRCTYNTPAQLGSGEELCEDVIDHRWHGVVACVKPLVGMGFLITPHEVWWAKSSPRSEVLTLEVALTSWARHHGGRATFTCGIGESWLPGVPSLFNGDVATCSLGAPKSVTGRAQIVAALGNLAFAVLILPAEVTKVGRNRLWHLRADCAKRVPESSRLVLTRGRTGSFKPRG